MKNFCLSNLHYLLLALLVTAMTGCGANKLGTQTSANQPGAVTSKLVWSEGKSAGKSVASSVFTPAGLTAIQVTVTGTDNAGKAIPVVRGTIDGTTNKGTITDIYPGTVTLVVKAFTNGVVSYEGFAIGVPVISGQTTDISVTRPIVMSPPLEKVQDQACIQCHETTLDTDGQNLVADFKQSGHYSNSSWTLFPKYNVTGTGCAGCHGPSHNDVSPATSGRCSECHGAVLPASHKGNPAKIVATNCGDCHRPHNVLNFVAGKCIACHSVTQNSNASGAYVNDNTGVRSITKEFGKWSHHVTGVTLNDAHCTACHLEGTVVNGTVMVDTSVHMADAKTHLRNADTDADLAWDPASPNHTTMDNFCMSCHDANGATSPMNLQVQAYINANGIAASGKTASAKNPFGDTISNRYDKMQRPGVTDASSQFNTTNNSHHGVKGPRYSGRTRFTGSRQIASAATFANNSTPTLQGIRSTIYDAGNFNALYVPLGTDGTAATGLGDDSTLHCGDCHTVGQYKVGSATNADGSATPAAIGAHGSNNEYLLRNTLGTDQRHTQDAFTLSGTNVVTYTNPGGAFLVCYNCHAYSAYGSIYVGTGADVGNVTGSELFNKQSHAGEYDQQGRCNGVGNTLPFGGYTTGAATDGTQFSLAGKNSRIFGVPGKNSAAASYAGEQSTDYGNMFGIQCLNCHNSGVANAYGGIHGSAKNTSSTTLTVDASVTGGAYIDGMGNTSKVERFLPGLGNAMFAPGTLGGFTGGRTVFKNGSTASGGTYTTGGVSLDTNWEQKYGAQTATTIINFKTGAVTNTASVGAGCYTLDKTATGTAITNTLVGPSVTGESGPAAPVLGTWGGCNDHNAAQGGGTAYLKRVVRPVTY